MPSKLKQGLPFIAGDSTRAIFTGTFPGEASLARQQYYGHPRNQFWTLAGYALGIRFTDIYTERIAALTRRGFGMTDVLEGCRREGSLDSSIRGEKPNKTLKEFLLSHPETALCFTSIHAEKLFKKHFSGTPNRTITLPSPSPANAGMTPASKKATWKKLLAEFAE